MKTIKEIANELYPAKSWNGEFNLQQEIKQVGFIAGAAEAQRWIPIDEELPECNLVIEEGIRHSEVVFIKARDLEFPVCGVYIRANDDEFFEIFFNVEILQNDITYWRPIERK
jgi:hypothetical protein